MRYICLGYFDENAWSELSEEQQLALMDECFAYDDRMREQGLVVGGEALQSQSNSTTVRWHNGRALVTDGPFAETKEQLGGFFILEARDLNHAIEVVSNHPGIRIGPFEIRPTDDMSGVIKAIEKRRAAAR